MKNKKNQRKQEFKCSQLIKAYCIMKIPTVSICDLCGGVGDGLCNDKCIEYQRKYKRKRGVLN